MSANLPPLPVTDRYEAIFAYTADQMHTYADVDAERAGRMRDKATA